MADVTRALLGRPQRYTEGWSSENKRICVSRKHLLCGEGCGLAGPGGAKRWHAGVTFSPPFLTQQEVDITEDMTRTYLLGYSIA